MPNSNNHKALAAQFGDDWECSCGEFYETQVDLLAHIQHEQWLASPEGQRQQELNKRLRAEFTGPLYQYVMGLVTKDWVMAKDPTLTGADIDRAWQRRLAIIDELN